MVTLLACLSLVAVVQPTSSSLPLPRRDLFFDETPPDGKTVTAVRGSDVVLDCQAIGTPVPTIHWLHAGQRVAQVPQQRWLEANVKMRTCGDAGLQFRVSRVRV